MSPTLGGSRSAGASAGEGAQRPTTLLVVAGEASGDLHGAELLRELKARAPGLRIVGIGGEKMSPFLDRKLADVSDLSVMGLAEVLKHLPELRRIFDHTLAAAAEERVAAALFIDYPGFNFRLAKALRKRLPSVRLHQFVCPQVWAWKKGRIPKLGRTLDVLYCLFPFEPELFAGHPVEAVWVGHPLVEVVKPEVDRATFLAEAGLDPGRRTVALLPGSRRGEISRLLPHLAAMVRTWEADPARERVQWVLPLASTVDEGFVRGFLGELSVRLVRERTYAALAYADAALVASGTATLECALLGTPLAALYRFHPLTYLVARLVVTVKQFSLPNIVAGRAIIPELIQGQVTAAVLADTLAGLLDPARSAAMRQDLAELRGNLGEPGAAGRVAGHLLKGLHGTPSRVD
jgi:lipid-A-disaccharide synthase